MGEERDSANAVAETTTSRGFLALYEGSYGAMVKLAALLVDRVDVAEEIVQDSFMSVYERWSSTDDPAAYLRTCVVNRCRDVQRRRRLGRQRDHLAVYDPSMPEPELLRDAIRALPASQRVALVLRYYEDLTVPKIAEVMGARQGTVKSWLHRAISELREVMEP